LLEPYANPFDFIECEEVLSRLKAGYDEDLAHACAVTAFHASDVAALFLMPNEPWARRVSGAFANHLVHAFPARAHAILTTNTHGTATVSIRAPAAKPRDADQVATRFANGGGRAIAAGIESFPFDQLAKLLVALEETYH
jgi:hypothetical protein